MLIFGAGMAGLLAAHMLRRFSPVIKEAQPMLPNNHDALLRFRSDAVSRATGIPFKKVLVHKAICYGGELFDKPSLRFSNMYSAKVTGKVMSRSILNLEPGERFIAPPDFIQQMALSCNIEYGTKVLHPRHHNGVPCISTMPMPTMMKMVGWKDVPEFGAQPIATISCIIDGIDIYQTLYYPDESDLQYRASITGNRLMIEIANPDRLAGMIDNKEAIINNAMCDFGIFNRCRTNVSLSVQEYGKIIPIADDVRKQFILALTDLHNVYSVGRFGTWRQILLDDVVRDISLVEQLISERCAYQARLAKY